MKKSEDEFITYDFLLTQCLNVAPKEGFTASDMKKRLAVLKVVDSTKEGETFDLKAEEIMTIKPCVAAMKWAVMHADIATFCEEVEAL
jgi:hypothetical protein